ncbi:hypothetical protein GCM10009416_38690 [Craurococcus roseus]|uniref:Uncharacterized protein n=1 Tax=Craurococcus roseus TaxID=77585 RepID=A0ABP3QSS8_9PROT
MPVVRHTGRLPASIAEGSGPGDWIAGLALSGDTPRLAFVETAGPMAAFFSAAWDAGTGLVTIRPDARLDFEAFSETGTLPQAEFALRFVFDDGSVQADGPRFGLGVLDRDDTPSETLSFVSGGTVAAGAIGATIGKLSVGDPDSAGPFFFSFAPEDEWRFEVVDGGVLKLRDGISLGWDDLPVRPVLIQVSDGAQSAAFLLDVSVTEPDYGPAAPYAPPVLAGGEAPRAGGFVLAGGGHEGLTTRPAADATAVTPHPGGVHQVLLDTGEAVWTGPAVDRVRFSDGWLDLSADGPAAHAAALHRAILAEDADGADLAPLVASLRAGAGWVEVARTLLASTPSSLAALDDAGFVRALAEAALGGAAPESSTLSLHAERLAAGAASRAQVAVDLALSPEALADLAENAPAGHWVAEPFDAASGQTGRPDFEDAPFAPGIAPPTWAGWFM